MIIVYSLIKLEHRFFKYMKKTIIYIFILFLSFSGSFKSFAQVLKDFNNISVFFGDRTKSSSSVESLDKTKTDELLCIQNRSSIFSRNKSKYTFDLISDYSIPKTKPIAFYGEGDKTKLIDYTFIGNQVLGLSYRTTFLDQSPAIYYHFIEPQLVEKSNHGFLISSFNSTHATIDLSRLTLVSSKNGDYAAVFHTPITKPEEYTSIKYAIIKDNYSIVSENEFQYPFPSIQYKPLEYLVIDELNQFFISGHYIKNKVESELTNIKPYFKSLSVSKITDNKLSIEKIESPGKYFTEVEVKDHKEGLVISGLYSSYIDGQIEGAYIVFTDQEGKLKEMHFTPFPSEILGSIKVFKDDYFTNQVRSRKDFSKFNIIDFKQVEGGYILSTEFNAVEYRYGGTDTPGSINTIDTYFWSSDIILSKIDANGKLIWCKLIPKIQRSINDGGYYLSTASYFSKKNIHLFFNDNLSNYNKDRNYIKTDDTPFSALFNSSKNTIAHVTINIENGTVSRGNTIGKDEMKTVFVPRLSVPFENTKRLMIYGRSGNKHRLGSVYFNE